MSLGDQWSPTLCGPTKHVTGPPPSYDNITKLPETSTTWISQSSLTPPSPYVFLQFSWYVASLQRSQFTRCPATFAAWVNTLWRQTSKIKLFLSRAQCCLDDVQWVLIERLEIFTNSNLKHYTPTKVLKQLIFWAFLWFTHPYRTLFAISRLTPTTRQANGWNIMFRASLH